MQWDERTLVFTLIGWQVVSVRAGRRRKDAVLSRGGRMPMPQVRDVLEAGMAGAACGLRGWETGSLRLRHGRRWLKRVTARLGRLSCASAGIRVLATFVPVTQAGAC